MLSLKIGESFVDTRNLEIPVVLRNPIFNDGKGSFIFSFSLPATLMLKEEFGYFHRPSRSTNPYITKPLELTYGTLKFKGTSKVTTADDETYEVSCPIDSGDLAKIFKSLKMGDIDMGGTRIDSINPTRTNANTSSDLIVNLSDPDLFTHVITTLEFDDIIDNPDNEFNVTGRSFESSMETILTFVFKIKAFSTYNNTSILRIYKNSLLIESIDISSSYAVTFDVDMQVGDIITWDISIDAIFDTNYYVNYTVFSGSKLIVRKQLDEIVANGLGLYPYSDYAIFPIENAKFFDNLEDNTFMIDNYSVKEIYSKHFPILNYYANGKFPLTMTGTKDGELFTAFNLMCPFPYLAYFIKRMAKQIGLEIENNLFETNQLKQLVIFNAFAENNYIDSELISNTEGFDLADHLPDVLISDYWKELCKLLGIAWDYKSFGSKLRLKNLKDIATDSAFIDFPGIVNSKLSLQASPYNGYKLTQEVTGDSYISDFYKSLEGLNYRGSLNSYWLLPWNNNEINDCFYLVVQRAYYIWNYNKDTASIDWIFHSNDFIFTKQDFDESIDATTLEITSKINAIMNNGNPRTDNQLGSAENRYWSIPKTGQPGNFDGLQKIFKANFTQSLLFYRGLRSDGQSNLYPLGTFDVFDYAGDVCEFESLVPEDAYTADLSLRWEGDYGLYEKRYKHWINFLLRSRGEWEFQATLTEQQVSEVDFFKWYRILNHPYLIKEMRFNLYANKISPVIFRAVAR